MAGPRLVMIAAHDHMLIGLIASGDLDAFRELHHRHADALRRFVRRVCVDPEAAEDVLQNTMLAIWRGAGGFDPAQGNAQAWMFTVARNRAYDHLRAQRRSQGLMLAVDALADFPAADRTETSALRWADRVTLRAALAALPPEQRHAIELAFFHDLSQVPGRGVRGLRRARR